MSAESQESRVGVNLIRRGLGDGGVHRIGIGFGERELAFLRGIVLAVDQYDTRFVEGLQVLLRFAVLDHVVAGDGAAVDGSFEVVRVGCDFLHDGARFLSPVEEN